MSAQVEAVAERRSVILDRIPVWLWVGAGVYLRLLIGGNLLLNDSDTYWHIAAGRWILDHSLFPRADIYSFTKIGEPWVSTSWLAQVLYAESYRLSGWVGPVILAAACCAVTFALLAFLVSRRIFSSRAIIIALAALLLSIPHLLTRPHVLALPVMLAWVNGLVSASERRQAPSFWLLPLIALWANLHGGFVFGLALIAPFALDALWNAEASQRKLLTLRWAAFGSCAIAACCATPYGWGAIFAASKILELGELLHLIYEWMPVDFSRIGPFELCVFALIAGVLRHGIKLSPPRIFLVLGLLYMALSHVRNIEIFALLMPLVALTPVASHFSLRPDRLVEAAFPIASVTAVVGALALSTWAVAANGKFSPVADQAPVAAVDVLKGYHAKRIFNDLLFGGYLISQNIPVFIDGRAELYGERFEMDYYRAVQLKNVNLLLDLFKNYDIDAVLLAPSTPAVGLLDHLDGWQRVYSDETAVAHIRVAR
jgi:hypothetical protein